MYIYIIHSSTVDASCMHIECTIYVIYRWHEQFMFITNSFSCQRCGVCSSSDFTFRSPQVYFQESHMHRLWAPIRNVECTHECTRVIHRCTLMQLVSIIFHTVRKRICQQVHNEHRIWYVNACALHPPVPYDGTVDMFVHTYTTVLSSHLMCTISSIY